MKCPNCEEGFLNLIRMNHDNSLAYLCEFCGKFWLKGESIKLETANDIHDYAFNLGRELTFTDAEEFESQSTVQTDFR